MRSEEIRKLDGEGLTRLALELGLVPEDVSWPPGCAYAYDEDGHAWRPWSRLAQADAVFRGLRVRGWSISVRSQQAEDPGSSVLFGVAEACHDKAHTKIVGWWSTAEGGTDMDGTEAMALLRASVLAVASMQEAPIATPCTHASPLLVHEELVP